MGARLLARIMVAAALAVAAGVRPDAEIENAQAAQFLPEGKVPVQIPDVSLAAQGTEKKEKAPKKPQGGTRVRLVWNDRPSLRIGRLLRVDLRVRVQGDFRQSPRDLTGYGGTFELARRRAGVEGTILRVFEYEVEHDLAKDGEWRDVYLNFRPTAGVQVQAGRFKMPFSLEATTGAANLDFVYRSMAAESLAPGRDVGVMVHGRLLNRGLHYEAGIFRHDGSNTPRVRAVFPDPAEPQPIQGRTVAVRVSGSPLRLLPVPAVLQAVEVGGAFTTSDVPEGPNHLQGHRVLGGDFFPRSVYVRGRRLRLGAEVNWTPGPFSVKWEYLRSEEARTGQGVGSEAGPDNDLAAMVGRGWYLSGTWLVTGENKAGGVTPRKGLMRGGFGAIEIGARYDDMRFSSGDQVDAPSRSPRAPYLAPVAGRVWTVGATWYVDRWVKVQLNGIREQVTGGADSPGPDAAPAWSWVCRLQFVL